MSKFILIDIFEHFSLAFTNKAFLFDRFVFVMFAMVAFPCFTGLMQTGIVTKFMYDSFTRRTGMNFECLFSILLLFSSTDFFIDRIFGETNLTK